MRIRMKLTTSNEEYLHAIYVLTRSGKSARITDIASFLGVQKPSAHTAINTLKEEGMIFYEKYKEITLTDKGEACAEYIHRRHELFKKFLTKILEVDEALAESEADSLSHCVSCHTTAKLENFIGELLKKQE